MTGKTEDMKGRVKEAVGDVTGDEKLQAKGKADQTSGKAKDMLDKANDWAGDKVDDVKDKVAEVKSKNT